MERLHSDAQQRRGSRASLDCTAVRLYCLLCARASVGKCRRSHDQRWPVGDVTSCKNRTCPFHDFSEGIRSLAHPLHTMRIVVLLLGLMATAAVRLPTAPRAPAAQMRATSTTPNPAELLRSAVDAGPSVLRRLASREAIELQRELAELALQQDPQVVFRRSIDLARALQTVGTEAAVQVGPLGKVDDLKAPMLLRRLCEELGATYVKLGQFIASSPTLFPPEYVAEFQKTLDATPPMEWSVVQPIIEKELGRPIGQVYASVERTPLAAASIAQVHAAKLRTGEDVVIKVQKAGVQGSLRADLDLLYGTARVLELLGVSTSELSVSSTLRP